jgi:hypothetical protein
LKEGSVSKGFDKLSPNGLVWRAAPDAKNESQQRAEHRHAPGPPR